MSVVDSTLDDEEFNLKRQLGSAKYELKNKNFWRAAFAEFIGSFFFQLVGGLTIFNLGLSKIDNGGIALASIGSGIGLIAVIGFTGHISGGHINPAVSLGMCITKQITVFRCIVYVFAQLAGCVSCSLILQFITCSEDVDFRIFGAFTVSGSSDAYKGFVLELLSTWFLVMVIFGCHVDNKGATNLTSLIIGFAFTANVAAIAPYTGAALNPARAFGPAVAFWSFDNHWVYWAGPLLGGSMGALTYNHILFPFQEAMVTHLSSFDHRHIEMLLPKHSVSTRHELPENLPLAKNRAKSRQMMGAHIDSSMAKNKNDIRNIHENRTFDESDAWKHDSLHFSL